MICQRRIMSSAREASLKAGFGVWRGVEGVLLMKGGLQGGGAVQGDSALGDLSPRRSVALVPRSVPWLRERPGGWQAGGARHRLWPCQVNLHQTQPPRNRKEAGRKLDGGHQVQCDMDTNHLFIYLSMHFKHENALRLDMSSYYSFLHLCW